MYSLNTIIEMNREKGKEAKKSKAIPYLITSQEEIDNYPPFPFPNIGDYRPTGWKLEEQYLVDSTGWGRGDEFALTIEQLKERLTTGKGYAIIEVGQFQLYVGEFAGEGEMNKEEIKKAQRLINSGDAWKLEGSIGRWCMDLIRAGYCILGKVGHRDFYGSYVPSRYEVKAGTMGSIEYKKQIQEERER